MPPLAPAFKRGLSAEQADWGSKIEAHPPVMLSHDIPPHKCGGGKKTSRAAYAVRLGKIIS